MKNRRLILGGLAAIAVTAGGCYLPTPIDKALKAPAPGVTSGVTAPPTARVAAHVPLPSEFTIEVIELAKSCYGSAGCNVTYEIEPRYGGAPLDSSHTFKVIFALDGGDAPEMGNFTVRGANYNKPSQRMIGTPSSSSTLSARVTRVVEE